MSEMVRGVAEKVGGGEKVGCGEKVSEDVGICEQSLEDVRDGGRSFEKVGCSEKVWEDVRKGEKFGGC
jgi:hypothetical protein